MFFTVLPLTGDTARLKAPIETHQEMNCMSKADRQLPTIPWQMVRCLGRMLFYITIVAGFVTLFQGPAAAQEPAITNIKPITQRDTILPITFNKTITPGSVRIGNAEATVVSQVPCDKCEVRVPDVYSRPPVDHCYR